ncbi:hyalin-like [Anneissia japonica]|uniref:hyalin-like n=1 Tax=Anneissia japonica TaxID=1529436 RepID=UPI00142582F9|nr:hyalin-like [Anneissia japonica]
MKMLVIQYTVLFGLLSFTYSAIIFDNCPEDDVVVNNTDEFPYVYTIPVITATVNSTGVAAAVNLTSLPSYTLGDNVSFPADTADIFEYTATASGEETIFCIFILYIYDTADPNIYDCPHDTTVNTTFRLPTANVSWNEPFAEDNSGTVNLTVDIEPASIFQIGDTLVTYIAEDPSGNTDMCSFTLTVQGFPISDRIGVQ